MVVVCVCKTWQLWFGCVALLVRDSVIIALLHL